MYFFIGSIVITVIVVTIVLINAKRSEVKQKEIAKAKNLVNERKKIEQKRIADKKGELGEYKINFQIEGLPSEYKYLADIMIKSKKGLTQIDHVVVSPFGIFVIETKNYAGWIFGDQKDKYWTQTFYNKKNRFYNPIRQNYGHVQALKELLEEYKNVKFHPIIAFSRRCELRGIKSDIPVIYDTEITNVILRRNKEVLLSSLDVTNIYNKIKSANITDQNIRDEHIQQIKRRMQSN